MREDYPKAVILDTAAAVREFRSRVADLNDKNIGEFAEDTVVSAIPYMCDIADTEGNLIELLAETSDAILERNSQVVADVAVDAVRVLTHVVFEALKEAHLYDHQGHLVYKLASMSEAGDMLLVPVTPADYQVSPPPALSLYAHKPLNF